MPYGQSFISMPKKIPNRNETESILNTIANRNIYLESDSV